MGSKANKRRKKGKPPQPQAEEKPLSLPTRAERGLSGRKVSAIVGAISLALGLLIFRPQISASPSTPLERSDPFSVPIKISNVGHFPIYGVNVHVFIHRLAIGWPSAVVFLVNDEIAMRDGLWPWTWSTDVLLDGDSMTTVFPFKKQPVLPLEADIAIIVKYNAWGLPFIPLQKVFRFTGVRGESWQWVSQPSSEISKEVDQAMKNLSGSRMNRPTTK